MKRFKTFTDQRASHPIAKFQKFACPVPKRSVRRRALTRSAAPKPSQGSFEATITQDKRLGLSMIRELCQPDYEVLLPRM